MSNDSDALIREVQEEMRRERLAKLWQQYGPYVIAIAGFIVVGVGGYKFWESQKLAEANRAGSRYETALILFEQGKSEDGSLVLSSLAKGSHAGYATLAKLRMAGKAIEDKKPGDAVAQYEAIAKDESVDPLFRDFALLRIVSLKLSEEGWTDIKNRLTEIVKPDRPWRHAARELLGVAAYKAGEFAEARQALAELIGDSKVPPAIIQRAQILLGLIATQAPPAPIGLEKQGKGDATGQKSGTQGTPGKKN